MTPSGVEAIKALTEFHDSLRENLSASEKIYKRIDQLSRQEDEFLTLESRCVLLKHSSTERGRAEYAFLSAKRDRLRDEITLEKDRLGLPCSIPISIILNSWTEEQWAYYRRKAEGGRRQYSGFLLNVLQVLKLHPEWFSIEKNRSTEIARFMNQDPGTYLRCLKEKVDWKDFDSRQELVKKIDRVLRRNKSYISKFLAKTAS